MGDCTNYWKVKEKIVKENFIYSFYGHWPMNELRDKAKELYDINKNECDGILFRIIRENVYGQCTNFYFLYYDGKKFHKDPDDIYFLDPFTGNLIYY